MHTESQSTEFVRSIHGNLLYIDGKKHYRWLCQEVSLTLNPYLVDIMPTF